MRTSQDQPGSRGKSLLVQGPGALGTTDLESEVQSQAHGLGFRVMAHVVFFFFFLGGGSGFEGLERFEIFWS